MVCIYAIQVREESHMEVMSAFGNLLSQERVQKTKKYKFQMDQMHCILGEVLLKYALWKHYKIAPEQVDYQYNEYKKPSLVKYGDIYFNISHSGSWVVCGISNTPIGVDVEGGRIDILPIAERFFTQNEYRYIQSQLECNQKDAFYKVWTLKESYIKCLGMGLYIPLDSFEFKFNDETIQMYQDGKLDQEYAFQNHKMEEGFNLSICSERNEFGISADCLSRICLEELLDWGKFKI